MIVKEILNRRATSEYKPDSVSDEQIIEIIKAWQFAPTARDNQAVEVVIRD
jgi:nitroreductase